jgi:hypothetical protein
MKFLAWRANAKSPLTCTENGQIRVDALIDTMQQCSAIQPNALDTSACELIEDGNIRASVMATATVLGTVLDSPVVAAPRQRRGKSLTRRKYQQGHVFQKNRRKTEEWLPEAPTYVQFWRDVQAQPEPKREGCIGHLPNPHNR